MNLAVLLNNFIGGLAGRLMSFGSRKFILAILGVTLLPQLAASATALSPYIWAGVAIIGLYILAEGTQDTIRALAELEKAKWGKWARNGHA